MSLPINPYITGNPVGTTDAFIGRQDVLKAVLQVLKSPSQNAITLFGQRRIGKTSILENLAQRLLKEGAYHPVYFDLQDKAAWTVQQVLVELERTIAESLGIKPSEGEDIQRYFKETWLPDTLRQLPEKNSLVLLFDEFDVLTDPKDTQAVTGFFPYLRELLSLKPERLQFVFVLGRNLSDLNQIVLSLFKGVPDKRVSLLAQEDVSKLLRLSEANNTLQWSDEAINRVWKLTHGHPFLTQALASQVWNTVYEEEPDEFPLITSEMVDIAAPPTLESSRNTLTWLWEGLEAAERVVASALAQAGDEIVTETDLERILRESGVRILIRELQNAPQLLKEWDILEAADGGYCFRVELFRRWIVEHRPLQRVQEELDHIQPVAESMFQAASGLYRNGDMERAEEVLDQALGLNPSHVRASELLAKILTSQDRLDEARGVLENLLELAPTAARSRLIQIYLTLAKRTSDDKLRLELLEKVIWLDPTVSEARAGIATIRAKEKEENELAKQFLEGRQALRNRKWQTAEEALHWVVSIRPAYKYEGELAADLLAKAVRQKKLPSSFLQRVLRYPRRLAFAIGAMLLLLLIFLFGSSLKNPMGLLQPVTPTNTPTHSPTPTLLSPPTISSALTPSPAPVPTIQRSIILFDASKNIGAGIDSYPNTLETIAGQLELTMQVDRIDGLAQDLSKFLAIIVHVNAAGSSYYADEAKAIFEYIESGGGMIVLGEEAEETVDPNKNIIAITELWNFRTGGLEARSCSITVEHPITKNIQSLELKGAGSIIFEENADGDWDKLCTNGDDVFIASREFGEGKIVVFGDADILNSGNDRLATNILMWLIDNKLGGNK